jgi:drug/metabolite transporter (DMT)-like permease
MHPKLQFWLLASFATLGWGVQSLLVVFIHQFKVHPLVLETVYGLLTCTINLVALICTTGTRTAFTSYWEVLGSAAALSTVLVYCFLNIGATVAFLYAAKLDRISISVLTATTSAYPLITLVLAWAFLRDYQHVQVSYSVTGIVLVVLGLIFLSLSSKPH